MFRIACALFLLAASPIPASATWSVVALDQKTGTIVVASATCVPQAAFLRRPSTGLRDIQAIVAPGVGAAAAQAAVDNSRANQRLIYAELLKGTDPAQILELLKQDPNVDVRQFGILDMKGRHTGWSGPKNQASALHEQGQVEGTGIWYSIQGNILMSVCGLTRSELEFIVDRSPYKHGFFTPGNAIPVHPVERLEESPIDCLFLLAWNFADEVIRQQRSFEQRGGRFAVPVPRPRLVGLADIETGGLDHLASTGRG